MTSKSPYKKNYQNDRQRLDAPRLTQKSRTGKSIITNHYTPEKKNPQFTYKGTERKKNDTYVKVQSLLDQNKYLLAENSELSRLVSERGNLIVALEEKLERQMNQQVVTLEEIQIEKNRFVKQFQSKHFEYELRIESLLAEIGQLNQQLYKQQLAKQREYQQMKNYLMSQHKRQIENLTQSHLNSTSILEIQLNKMKDILEKKDNKNYEQDQQYKHMSQRYKQQLASLNDQLLHLTHMKKLQTSEQRVHYENIIQNLAREGKKEKQINLKNYQLDLIKMKHAFDQKQHEIQQLSAALEARKSENKTISNEMLENKTQLQAEMLKLQQFYKRLLDRQKSNLKDINNQEVQLITHSHKNYADNLCSQICRLKQLNEIKSKEIQTLYQQINQIRSTKNQEITQYEKLIEQLKYKLHDNKESNLEDEQAFKIKMAQLHYNDISSLKAYYENQINILVQDLANRQQVVAKSREKLHKQIQEKTELRKIFEAQLNKLKIKLGELQIKLANSDSQRRQLQANMSSKVQLTSMNLIRQSNEKEKNTLFFEQQRRKYQILIQSKDGEIQNLNLKIDKMKQDHSKENKDNGELISDLNKKCQKLEESFKKQQSFHEKEIKKKQLLRASDKQFYQKQLQKIKEEHSEQFSASIKQFTNQKTTLQLQRNQLKVQKRQLLTQLTRIKQSKQQQGLDKDIVLNNQTQRLKGEKDYAEVSLKKYYNHQIENKNNEIKDLKQQIKQKQEDYREMKQKYHKLDKKLNLLLESQEKLRDIQNKVLAVGQDNNAIKNIAEMLKNRRKN